MTRNEVMKTVQECFPTLSYDQQELMADAIIRRLECGPVKFPRKDLIQETLKKRN